MKFLLILVLLAIYFQASCTEANDDYYTKKWLEFKQSYGKFYETNEEDSMRMELFLTRLNSIKDFNEKLSKQVGYEQGLNRLSDLNSEEYLKLNGLEKIPENLKFNPSNNRIPKSLFFDVKIPDEFDYSQEKNIVGPVRDQGKCGACWAFATIGLLEGREYMNSTANELTQLSVQNLLDCSGSELNLCEGKGSISDALNVVKQNKGLNTEEVYPYVSGETGKVGSICNYDQQKAFITTMYVEGSQVLPEGDENFLKKTVARISPVAVGVDASQESFRNYKSGTYFDENCSSTNINHAMLVVGYGIDENNHQDYWLLKNSWGSDWGMAGYMRLARNRNNHCGVATMATIALPSR